MTNKDTRIGHVTDMQMQAQKHKAGHNDDFVLEKSIFNNIFEKDIKRVFIYKKSERLAKALHLVTPAFAESVSLRNRIDAIAIGLVDAAVLPPSSARTALSRELLSLSSVLSIARTGGLLSAMNADLIAREAQILLQEVATYEEPRLFLDDAPTLSGIAKHAPKQEASFAEPRAVSTARKPLTPRAAPTVPGNKSQVSIKDVHEPKDHIKDRREAVLSVIRAKKQVGIKDISTLIRGVSEKTIQRELAALVSDGIVEKHGERRWSVYTLV